MKLTVVFPGIGYHCDKPLLYYGRKIAAACGYDKCITVDYTGFENNIKGDAKKMEEAFYLALHQAEEILNEVKWEEYEEVLFLSKSIGTIVAAAYAQKHNVSCRNVFYTPLEHTFLFAPKNGIAFSGTADNWVNPEKIISLCEERKLPLCSVEKGNHSLETGEVFTDLSNLQKIMEKTKEFLSE